MVEIPVERKGGVPWWVWLLLAAILVALLIWWATSDDEVETVEVDPVAVGTTDPITPATTPEMIADAPGVSIGDILGNPASYLGRDDFQAEVTVPTDAQMTDRGFWIEDEGARLFAILIDGPMEEPKHINPGQTLRISEGLLRDRTYLPELRGEPLDANTDRLAQDQPIFVVVDEENVQILERGVPQPGTGYAPSAPRPAE